MGDSHLPCARSLLFYLANLTGCESADQVTFKSRAHGSGSRVRLHQLPRYPKGGGGRHGPKGPPSHPSSLEPAMRGVYRGRAACLEEEVYRSFLQCERRELAREATATRHGGAPPGAHTATTSRL